MSIPIHLLVLEDNPSDAELVILELRRAGFEPDWKRVETEADFLAALDPSLDLILADYHLPQFDGLRALNLVQESKLGIPLMIVSGTIGDEMAVEAMKKGATDYLLKDRLARLGPAVKQALEHRKLVEERKQTEEQLRHQTIMLDSVNEAIVASDAKVRLIAWNAAAERLYGWKAKEVLGHNTLEILRTEWAGMDAETMQKAIEKQGHWRGEVTQARKDGSRIPIEMSALVQTNANGQTTGYLSINHDISERKQAERALAESAIKFKGLFEYAPMAYHIISPDGTITDVNRRWCELLGYCREEALGKAIFDFMVEQEREAAKASFNSKKQSKQSYVEGGERNYRTKDGKVVTVKTYDSFSLDERKNVVSIQTAIENITERKQAVEALARSEKDFRNLVENSLVGIFRTNLKGELLFVNDSLVQILGFDSKLEIMQAGVFSLYKNPADRVKLLEIMQKEGKVNNHETDLLTKTGATRNILMSATFEKDTLNGMIIDITERKQTEEALHESEKKFRSLFESSQDAIMLLEPPSWKFTTGNPATLKMFGAKTEEEFISYEPGEISPDRQPDGRSSAEKSKEMIDTALRAGSHFFEWTHRRISGEEFPADVLLTRIAQNGKVIIQATVRDISERKRAEEALRESESEYRNLFENSVVGISQARLDGQLIRMNRAYAHMYGYENPEEMMAEVSSIGKQLYAHPQDREEVLHILAAQGIMEPREIEVVHRDGTRFFVLATARAIKDSEGNIRSNQAEHVDITERKEAELALHDSELKLRSLFTAMLDVIIIYDSDGRYLEIAPTNPSNLSRPSEELVGRTLKEVYPTEQASFFLDTIHQALENGQPIIAEYSLNFGSEVRWFSASVSPLSSNSVIWVAHDITHRKDAENKIHRQLEHLTALSSIDRVISANFDLGLSLSEILNHVTKELAVDAANILILNTSTRILEFGAERGFRTPTIRKAHVQLGESYAGRIALERQLVQIPDLKNETDKAFLATHLAGEDFVCYYGVPLIAKGQVKGVMEVFHRTALAPDAEWFDFLNTLGGQTAIAIENSTLFESLQRSNSELGLAYDATIEGWSHALDLRDKETEGHTQRVTEMTIKLAGSLGLGDKELTQVRWGALLHDIGKMGIPDGILLKPGPLTDEEWLVMKKHPDFAYEMLSPIRYLKAALDIPYCHHEKWDGTGYPRGLKGEQIPLAARIFAVVDVWDALTSDRPYRQAWSEEKAREHIQAGAGTHFDPQVVKTFLLHHEI